MKAGPPPPSKIIRRLGDVFGGILVLGFVVSALSCWTRYEKHMSIAGWPSLSLETMQFLVADGALLQRIQHWVAAWAFLVASGGFALLAVAGLRWAVIRARDALAVRGS